MTDRGSTPDADAGLPLRHRLFPRAMAWNVQRQSGSPTAEQLVLAAAQVLEQQQRSHVDTMDVARSFPLLQASVADESFRPVPVTQDAPPRLARTEGDERERLFRAMGKYLDGTTATGPCSAAQTSPVYAQQTPLYYQAPPPLISRPYGGMPSPDRMTAEQQGAFQAMKISSYAEEEQRSWASQSQVLNAGLRTPPAVSPTPPGVHQIKLRSPPSATSGQKRTRGSTPAASSTSTAVGKDEIAPSLARALLTGCGAKQCSFEGSADKASKPVSKAKSAAKSSSSRAKTSSSSYTSADSDDSVDRQSTVSCDSSFSVAHNKENKRMASVECVREHKYVQHQYAGEVSGISTPSLQLPSLNEALLRTVPTQYSSEAIWSTRTPSPPAPPSHYKSGYRPWPANSA
ncbi:hypothetical protein PC122_g14323 [Phytophthora cactorum]|nr:hypothetical protein PC122_g14323 [Phytophthora cactorum]